MPTVRIPAPLRSRVGGARLVEVTGHTVGTALRDLERRNPGMGDRLLDGEGNLQRFVNVFVEDADVRALRGLETEVGPDDVISIVPAVAGG